MARTTRAAEMIKARKERQMRENWDPAYRDNSWMKWARCRICGRRICVNNYADRKVRIPKVRGVIVCPWCNRRDTGNADFLTALYVLVQKLSEKEYTPTQVMEAAQKVMAKSPEAKARARKAAREAPVD